MDQVADKRYTYLAYVEQEDTPQQCTYVYLLDSRTIVIVTGIYFTPAGSSTYLQDCQDVYGSAYRGEQLNDGNAYLTGRIAILRDGGMPASIEDVLSDPYLELTKGDEDLIRQAYAFAKEHWEKEPSAQEPRHSAILVPDIAECFDRTQRQIVQTQPVLTAIMPGLPVFKAPEQSPSAPQI